jgi:hypothetical protein
METNAMAEDQPTQWYWCLRHSRPESADRCSSDLLMGPYESREAAERFADTAKERDEKWTAEDEQWENR